MAYCTTAYRQLMHPSQGLISNAVTINAGCPCSEQLPANRRAQQRSQMREHQKRETVTVTAAKSVSVTHHHHSGLTAGKLVNSRRAN